MHLELVAVIVDDYDRAISFFVGVLGFELVEDSPSSTNDGRPKRSVAASQVPAGQVTMHAMSSPARYALTRGGTPIRAKSRARRERSELAARAARSGLFFRPVEGSIWRG